MRAYVRAVPLMFLAGPLLAGCIDSNGPKGGQTKAPAISDDMYVVKVEGMS
jgi:hypothetical protein